MPAGPGWCGDQQHLVVAGKVLLAALGLMRSPLLEGIASREVQVRGGYVSEAALACHKEGYRSSTLCDAGDNGWGEEGEG